MKNGFFGSKIFLILILILFIASLAYLSTEEKYVTKEVIKEIKLITNIHK